MFHEKTVDAARGKWRGILLHLGLPEASLRDRHGPCPLCGGKDRFRFDDKEGRGSYFCNACGAGDGMKLAVEYTGKTFREVASMIDGIVGNLTPETPKPEISEESRVDALRNTYRATSPVEPGDLVDTYLTHRGVDRGVYPETLRFGRAIRDGDGAVRPAMVAMVGRPGRGKFDTIHRTFLKPDGSGKAEMASPRKMMPGSIPDGACVQLSNYTGGPLGIAEGIETALAAGDLFEMPVWAALNSGMLKKWWPPEGCDEVAIFGDHDAKYGGQSAAYELAHRLAVKGIAVTVHLPDIPGQDWNDVLLAQRGSERLAAERRGASQ